MKSSLVVCILFTIFLINIINADNPVQSILKVADQAVADIKLKGGEAMGSTAKATEEGTSKADKANEEAEEQKSEESIGTVDNTKTT